MSAPLTSFAGLSNQVRRRDEAAVTGEVVSILGLSLTAAGLERAIGIGQRCMVQSSRGPILGEVVGIDGRGTRIMPFGTWDGVMVGDRVERSTLGDMIRPDDSWVGRVMDALGRPLDGDLLPDGRRARPVRASPPAAFERRRVGGKIDTQIKALDIFAPLCRGQRMGVFAGSGVGKSTLMAMLARQAQADVIVVGLVGERGREVQDFIQHDLGPEGMARSVIIVSTGDEPPLMRRQAAWTATAVAEHFRDRGKQVLLLLDSVTRFAMALREIGLAAGEPPTSKGYPPTVFSELPALLERAGPGTKANGDITALYTVLVDGDDMNEPVADSVRGILDGHLVLDRKIAERGRFPAVDLQKSISRMLPDCHAEIEYAILQAARRALARFSDMEELIQIGAYRKGADRETDAAIRFSSKAEAFLRQKKGEPLTSQAAFVEFAKLLREAEIPFAPT